MNEIYQSLTTFQLLLVVVVGYLVILRWRSCIDLH